MPRAVFGFVGLGYIKRVIQQRSWYSLTQPGWVVFVAALALSSVGIMCIVAAEGQAHVPDHAAARQGAYLVVSLAAFAASLRIGYQRAGRLAYVIFGISLVLLVPLFVAKLVGPLPLIPRIKGTFRWIVLPGFRLQPSEIMKIAYILGLAWYLRHKKNHQHFRGLIGPFCLTLIPMFLILLQPDLGTVLLMMPVMFTMLFAAGARVKHFAIIGALAVACVPLFWSNMEDYQRQRIAGLILQNDELRAAIIANPEKYTWLCSEHAARQWASGLGYQLVRSKGALGSGGAWGRGWMQGTYLQYNFLVFKHNDFIFSIIGEQWGLVGCLFVLSCYLAIVMAGFEIANATQEPFGKLLAVGVVALIATQCLINTAMTMGLMPITGVTLPLVSYGGSSMIATFAAIGLLVSVSQSRPFMLGPRPFEVAAQPRGAL